MVIDAREIELINLLRELKELFSLQCGADVAIDILMGNNIDSKKVAAFASMSGCMSDVVDKNSYFVVRIRGNICCS